VSIIASCSFVPRYVPPDFGARHKTEDARERQTQRQRNTTPHTTRRGTAPHRGRTAALRLGCRTLFTWAHVARPGYTVLQVLGVLQVLLGVYISRRRAVAIFVAGHYIAAWSSCCYAGRTDALSLVLVTTAAAKGCWQPCCWRWLGAPASSTPPGWTVSVLGVLCRAVRSSNAHRGGALLAQQLWYQAASCESPPGTQQ
jgi:hypothetical protein